MLGRIWQSWIKRVTWMQFNQVVQKLLSGGNRACAALPAEPIRFRALRTVMKFAFQIQVSFNTPEKHLTGKVIDLGGKSPNVHLILTDTGETVCVDATEQQLAAEKENHAYKNVTLRVQGEQHLRTKELRNLRLIQFSPQTTEVDEQSLASLWQKGREAWKEVNSAAGWVESLRGNT